MAGRPKRETDFNKVLEQGAQVDDIFKDSPAPGRSAPFMLDVSSSAPPLAINDTEENLCTKRKLAAVEALFHLVSREYYSFGQMISEILRVAMDQVGAEAGSFIELDHQNQRLFFRAVTGRASRNLLEVSIPVGQGIAGFVCETQQPMVLSNVDESQVYLRTISDSVGFDAKNLVAYPIVIRGATFGCLELLNRLTEPNFTESDREVLSTIAEYAAKVIENRLLFAAISKELAAVRGSVPGEDAA